MSLSLIPARMRSWAWDCVAELSVREPRRATFDHTIVMAGTRRLPPPATIVEPVSRIGWGREGTAAPSGRAFPENSDRPRPEYSTGLLETVRRGHPVHGSAGNKHGADRVPGRRVPGRTRSSGERRPESAKVRGHMNPGRTDARGGIRATMENGPGAPAISRDTSGRPVNASRFRASAADFAGYVRVE